MTPIACAGLLLWGLLGAAADDPFAVEIPPPPGFDREASAAQVLANLSALIGIDTTNSQRHDPESSRPNGNELATARWFEGALAGFDGVETHVLDAGDGRANFIARLRAVDPSARPVLVMGHMDVVGAESTKWDTPPYEATVKDGFIHGRGAIDCKGPLAAELTAFLALAERRAQLRRDVVFLATAAEEGGPEVGIARVLEKHRDLLGDPEFALNEGGRIRIVDGRIRSVNIQTTEKVPYNVVAQATGPSGHGSVPLPDNALAALSRAVSRVHDWKVPVRLNETTELYFARQALIEPDPLLKAAMESLAGAEPGTAAFTRAVDMLATRPLFDAVLRSGHSLTLLEGGFRTNVIPSSGSATFNVRVVPGDNIVSLVAQMNQVAAESMVVFELGGDPRPAPPASPVNTELYLAMEQAALAMVPDVVVIPFMSTGATDGAALRAAGIPTYGILPIPLAMEDELRMHGDNERAPVSGLGWAAEYIYRILLSVAG